MQFEGYDIIGDIHGCATVLKRLLDKLGYRLTAQGFAYHDTNHPRQVIFVGDLIDRGSEVVETLSIVKAMWDNGQAQVVMGNHELSAIAWHTPYQQGFVRAHNERAYRQLQATLEQFQQKNLSLAPYIEWFRELPLFLEMENFRVAHASWDEEMVQTYQRVFHSTQLVDDILYGVVEQGSFAQRFLERITRGQSLGLPNGYQMLSYDGLLRSRFRIKFWTVDAKKYADIVFQPDPLPEDVAQLTISEEDRAQLAFYSPHAKPLFVGHYWLSGEPALLSHNVACVDYSAVNGGRLVAYRFERGDNALYQDRFVSVEA